jgi:uncharacterized membrane protein YkoI
MKNLMLVVLIALTGVNTILADPAPTGTEISLEQATRQVIASNNANRVLSAKTEEIEGRKVHIIKTLTKDGRIQQQTIAADTGALLNIDND